VKCLSIASFFLIAPLLLSGCSSVPSLEEQTKLIEYEKCLSFAEMVQEQTLALNIKQGELTSDFSIEISIRDCKKYRP
jgi:hypothetical protein